MTERRLFASLIGGLIGTAWLTLFLWGQSPWGRFLSHEGLEGLDLGASYVTVMLVFVAGWTLMTVAMMLPTSLPLVYMFRVMTRSRPDGGRSYPCWFSATSRCGPCSACWPTQVI